MKKTILLAILLAPFLVKAAVPQSEAPAPAPTSSQIDYRQAINNYATAWVEANKNNINIIKRYSVFFNQDVENIKRGYKDKIVLYLLTRYRYNQAKLLKDVKYKPKRLAYTFRKMTEKAVLDFSREWGFAYLSYFSQEQDKFFDEIDSFIPPRVQRIQELYRLYKQGKVTFGKYFFTKKDF